MKRILITGGLGQVGSYLVDHFHSSAEITVLDNLSSPTRKDVPDNVTCITDDIRGEVARELVSDTDIVIHTAAQISVARSVEEPVFDADNNVFGTLNLLEAAREADLERFVYFSSAAVYGNPVTLPIDETHPQDPMSPYGASKLSGEKYCMMYNRVYDIPTVSIRPFNIYSPRQDPSNPYSGVISKFMERARAGLSPRIYGDGGQTRDFISVHDIVELVALTINDSRAIGQVLNAGTGKTTTINELAAVILDLHDQQIAIEHNEPLTGDIRHSVADISAARSIGFEPTITLHDGLKEFLD